MEFRLASRRKSINLEIKDYVIRYVDAKRAVPPLVSSFGETYLPPGIVKNGNIVDEKAFLVILRNCLDTWKLNNKSIHFIVPDSYVVVRKQAIPRDLTAEEIRGYIYLELGHSIHLPFENPTFDYKVIGTKEDKQEIMLFATPESLVQSYMDIFEKTKLRPVAADIAALSLYRLYYHMKQPSSGEELILLKIDLSEVTITIFHNHYPVFMQQQAFSYEKAVDVTDSGIVIKDADTLKLDLDELLEEIDRILHFYQYSLMGGAGAIQKLVLTGDHPFIQDVCESLKNRFSFTVDEIKNSTVLSASADWHSKYYPALGLALKGV